MPHACAFSSHSQLECLEVLNDLLRRFAANLAEADSRECLAALFDELTSSRPAARKRAIACIASLSASLPDRMLESQLVGAIFAQMTAPKAKLELRRDRPCPTTAAGLTSEFWQAYIDITSVGDRWIRSRNRHRHRYSHHHHQHH